MKNKPKLNQFERDRIEAMLNDGHEQKEIATVIGRHKSTISREIKRNRRRQRTKNGPREGPYQSSVANHKAYRRRKYAKYQGKKINESRDLRKYIVEGLRHCWQPDEISGRMKATGQPFYASKTAIYEWLYSVYGQRYCRLLPSKQYRKKPRKRGGKTKRSMIKNRVGIEAKPQGYKHEFGHLEHDTFVSGKKTGSKAAGSVLYEPLAKYVALEKISNLKPRVNERAVQEMLKSFSQAKSITRDNGIENKCHELTPLPSYFCDPYSAWQKPYVEQVIKTLRRFFKKGCDLSQYSNEEMTFVQAILNNKPRKNLGYKTPLEVMIEHGMLNVETINQWESFLSKKISINNKNRVSVAIEG
ncbi:MAG: hypothetical protein A3C50_02885 [Candidatus Staskawiczbacteria bacterium RIFCSPHIGHO2_02_FULL_43_16]|uniref:Transposase IS30-like HTH domain-containing protein n=1 Tax=Candidatus Staskawiczbacteria bacterium RIFCSPHIGHO2_01_FULL_41_41 TaxID=1802203 RepID=A0A1G2HSQ8_9BACT|nr:MAG: hypothetical protein A2822_03505 [Candidatus Staskawiczbacteria bacterium RIFCSPHIGHO2_01_FULL_41_41]OGZ68225.1 MAG: hypothetical protein A3C50_02885 [Candidatus Staskawiczbacteria bacterium RIFCSPHIGHO2_02_FULL_43_16]OGZ75014.1 MAG: hypothetical protein A3A12_04285 [Candidatus Staskawiczbacteria bacterium RIFCSPLOWO2_01_FULL_43_17b]